MSSGKTICKCATFARIKLTLLILPQTFNSPYFYLRRQLAAGQVMGPVVVVLVLFKTFTQNFIESPGRGKGGKVLGKAV